MSDLVTFVRSLIAAGAAQGWQSFGQGSEWDGTELGQDIGLPFGTAIPGATGVVTAVTLWGGQADYAVTERLADGTLLTVGHVQALVAVGQAVAAGQAIATSRGLPSAISSGPHIEFRVQPGGGNFVDPLFPWFSDHGSIEACPWAVRRAYAGGSGLSDERAGRFVARCAPDQRQGAPAHPRRTRRRGRCRHGYRPARGAGQAGCGSRARSSAINGQSTLSPSVTCGVVTLAPGTGAKWMPWSPE